MRGADLLHVRRQRAQPRVAGRLRWLCGTAAVCAGADGFAPESRLLASTPAARAAVHSCSTLSPPPPPPPRRPLSLLAYAALFHACPPPHASYPTAPPAPQECNLRRSARTKLSAATRVASPPRGGHPHLPTLTLTLTLTLLTLTLTLALTLTLTPTLTRRPPSSTYPSSSLTLTLTLTLTRRPPSSTYPSRVHTPRLGACNGTNHTTRMQARPG